VLADWRSAPVDGRLTAMLDFLETMTLRPEDLSAEAVRDLRTAGLSTAAIRDAIYVCFLFNTYDRLADSFHFRLPPEEEYQAIGRNLLKRGYV
jgi:alkylhydroperoxidase family enzyme